MTKPQAAERLEVWLQVMLDKQQSDGDDVEALRLAIDALIGGVRADQSPAIREALMVDCTCRVIEKCERCEAIDAAEDAPCKCGDYRSEHQDGTGRCLTCAAHAHMQPFVPCEQFRPSAENAPTHTQRVIAEVDAAVEQAFATEDSRPETWCDTCTSWRGNPYCGRVDCPTPAPFDWGDWRPCAHHPTADHEIVCFACNPILFGGMKGRQPASPGRTTEEEKNDQSRSDQPQPAVAPLTHAAKTEADRGNTWCDTCQSWRGNPYCGRVDCQTPAPTDYSKPLSATIESDALVIRIGVGVLAHAVTYADWANPYDDNAQDYIRTFAIEDAKEFARDVRAAMWQSIKHGEKSPLETW